jgi:hypothetical protein
MSRAQTVVAIVALGSVTAAGVALFMRTAPPSSIELSPGDESGATAGSGAAAQPRPGLDEPAPVPAEPAAPGDPAQLIRFDQALELEWQQRLAAGTPSGSTEFVDAWRATYLDIWAAAAPAERPRAFARASEALAIPYFNEHGTDAYAALGTQLTTLFVPAFEATLATCRDSGGPIWPCVVDAGQSHSQALISVAGDFVAFGMMTGLVTPDGQTTVSTPLLRAIFLYRWFGYIAASVPLEQALLPTEYRAFLRWRIEAARGVSPERRAALEAEFGAMFQEDRPSTP